MLNGALPPFDLADGGLGLALARAATVAALFSAFGTLLCRELAARRAYAIGPADLVVRADAALLTLVRWSLIAAFAVGCLWLVGETVTMADASTLPEIAGSLPTVLFRTSFGHFLLAQLAALAATAPCLWFRRPSLATLSAAIAVALQAGHSHAFSMDGAFSLPLASDALHLLAGGAWLGGLVPLLLLIRILPPKAGAVACRHFSSYGKPCVIVLAVSAVYQAWQLAGGLAGLVGTAYGWTLLVKAVLLAVLTLFALVNRYRLAPGLLRDEPAGKARLIRSIVWQTGAGLLVVAAAGILSSLSPGLHLQAVWPFTLRPSLVTVGEDPDFKREVVEALLALSGALLLAALGVAVRRVRWPALAAALIIAWFALPHLDLLFVEAYPTSYYRSPTGFGAISIVAGASLYPAQCASCHGADGTGDGPAAAGLPVPPADLTAAHLWAHSDGELFWWLSHGMDIDGGGQAMPGFAATLTEDERWALIDYIRAHNAGTARVPGGDWTIPVHAPDITAACPDGGTISIGRLRGKAVRLLFSDAPVPPQPEPAADGVAVVTIVAGAVQPAAYCWAPDPAVEQAYAIVGGLSPGIPSGTQFLIDPNGWLRATLPPGTTDLPPGILDERLLAQIREICTHPIASEETDHAHHH